MKRKGRRQIPRPRAPFQENDILSPAAGAALRTLREPAKADTSHPFSHRSEQMTYVVTEKCIRCKFMDCVEVCPVDCFYEGENMLVIHPDECIDCGVCEPECPVDAIRPDTEPGLDKWLSLNAEYANQWPNITIKRDAPADAKEFETVEGKFEKFFAAAPGQGD